MAKLLLLLSVSLASLSAALAQEKIKFPVSASSKTLGYSPLWVASKLGFFDKQGLEAQLVLVAGADKSTMALVGGSVNVSSGGTDTVIAAVEQGADLIDRMEAELRDMLKLNVFMAMTMKTKDMRVDEVMQVIGEQAALMAPRIGLMNSICLDNLHARMWSIEEQRGRLYQATNPPGIIMNYLAMSRKEAGRNGRKWRGLPIRVVYKGPMQLAQDSYFVQRRLMSGLAPINAYLVPIDAEAVADKIDVAVATEEVLDKTGFMQSAIRSKKAFDARQKKRAAAQAGLTDAQTAQGGARALRAVADAARTVSEKQL